MRATRTMTRWALLATLAILLTGWTAMAQERPLVTTLDNGVTVVVIENHQSPVVALRAYIKAGSMDEGAQGRGMSHLLEHLVASGTTATRTEKQSREMLDAIGAECNAYTSLDHMCYYMSTSARFFDTGVELLSDWVMNCTIPAEEFQRELEVVQREMESRRSDPNVLLHETMNMLMFQVHPVRWPVLGFRDSFRHITREDLLAYYHATFVPDNVLFVAAGDVNAKEATETIRKAFAPFERRPVTMRVYPEEPPQVAPREEHREMAASQARLLMAWRTVPLTDPALYPLDLLSDILSNGDSSRLVRLLREQRRLVTSVTTWSYTPGYDAGQFAIYATLDPANVSAAREAVLGEVRRAQEELVSDEELARAKRQKIAEYQFGRQTAEAQAGTVASDLLSAHDPTFSKSYSERIQKTTAEEIRAAARKYFDPDRLCVVTVTPPAKSAGPAGGTSPAKAGEIVRTELPNGMKLLIKRNPANPTVAVNAFFLGGLRAEPADKQGLSLFTAHMLTRGTRSRTTEQIARMMEDMGGEIGVSSGNNALYLSAACLKADLPRTLELTADVLRNPIFPLEEIDRLRPMLLAAAARQRDAWQTELTLDFREKFFDGNPYAGSALGTSESLKAITRDDLVSFHRATVMPNNMVLTVFGDVEPEAVQAMAQELFGDWPKGEFRAPKPPLPAPIKEDATVTERSNHSAMGGVFIGFPGMTLGDWKDRYAMDVLDAMTSGISLPRGWLHETLRGRGLVYEVHAYNWPGIEPGFFGIYAGTEPQKVEEVKKLILEQLGRLTKEPLAEAELAAARQVCVTADVLETQTNGQQAMRAGLDELYGLGYDSYTRYAEGVLTVTAADVKRVAEKYLTHYLCVFMVPTENE